MKKLIYLSVITSALIIVSCNSDDEAGNIITNNVDAPLNYSFDRDGSSTVDFSGQTTRIKMAGEITSAFLDFDNATQASLNAMFSHQEGGLDFNDAELNASDKSVRSKVAASQDYFSANVAEATSIKNTFDGFISNQIFEVFPNQNNVAAPGVAGQVADGSSTRYVSGSGLEYNQAFAKSLIGALMTDQMLNNYLSIAVLDEANNIADNDANITEVGKPYTSMEHKWDEAYGYIYGTSIDPTNPNATVGEDDNFLNEYTGAVNEDADFNTIAATIFNAFKLGRAAIVAKNYEVRDSQAAIIRQKISEVLAIRTVYYLQSGKIKIEGGNQSAAFHALSEVYGFIYSLRFTHDNVTETSFFSREEVDGLLTQLMGDGANGLWDVTPETLDSISESIAAKFNFTVAQAATVE